MTEVTNFEVSDKEFFISVLKDVYPSIKVNNTRQDHNTAIGKGSGDDKKLDKTVAWLDSDKKIGLHLKIRNVSTDTLQGVCKLGFDTPIGLDKNTNKHGCLMLSDFRQLSNQNQINVCKLIKF